MTSGEATPLLLTEEVMAEIRRELYAGTAGGVSAEVEVELREVLGRAGKTELLLPLLLGEEWEWRPELGLPLTSHRPVLGRVLVFLKRWIVLPLVRWLFDYARDNFRRQERLNLLLLAAVEHLARENVRLRHKVAGLEERGREAEDCAGPGDDPGGER
jgi:hypothetical protein